MAIINIFSSQEGKLKIGTLEVDVSLDESHERANVVTTNPVEQGVDIADHIQRQPAKLTVSGMVSATPIKFLSIGANETRLDDAWGALKAIHESGDAVDIETGLDLYENMVMVSLVAPRNATVGKALRFTASFVEVVVVESQTVTIAAKPDESAAKTASGSKDLGKQSPAPVTATDTLNKAGSILSRLTGLGG